MKVKIRPTVIVYRTYDGKVETKIVNWYHVKPMPEIVVDVPKEG